MSFEDGGDRNSAKPPITRFVYDPSNVFYVTAARWQKYLQGPRTLYYFSKKRPRRTVYVEALAERAAFALPHVR